MRDPVRGSDDYFQRQFETALDGILILDAPRRIVLDANSHLVNWLKYDREEWLGQEFCALRAFEGSEQAASALEEMISTGIMRRDGIAIRDRYGNIHHAEILGNLYRVKDRELAQLNIRDVSQRIRAESALRAIEERFRLFADNVTDYAFVLLDCAGDVVSWNAGAQRILGYSEQEAIGRSASRFFTPEDLANREDRNEMRTALERGRAEDERWHVRKDGSRFWSSGVMTPVYDPSGNLSGYAKVLRDITERKMSEAALSQQAEELARSNSDLQQFAYITSHDLQEPLRTITSYSQLLLRRSGERLDSETVEILNHILEGTRRMNTLIRDLLTYARVINTAGEPTGLVDLNGIVSWAILNLKTSVDETGASVVRDPLPTVQANSVQMLQVFQNLLGNALKYRGTEPPVIKIGAERKRDGEWLFWVSDNGPGIEPQYHERIFGLFKRLHGRDVPGTGIGLALCRNIIQRHGGRMWVESNVGQGATFKFTLPGD